MVTTSRRTRFETRLSMHRTTEKSEAIACAKRCQSSQLKGGGHKKIYQKKWRAKEEKRHKG
jgi:hypothetical protein